MGDRAAIRAEATRGCAALFEAAGARPVETAILQPAEVLLDLYGEDMRARAYVTSDALQGRADAAARFHRAGRADAHGTDGAEPARYTYAGEVFRRQEDDPDRPNEYFQAGFEVFGRDHAGQADAEVFTLFNILKPLKPARGDGRYRYSHGGGRGACGQRSGARPR